MGDHIALLNVYNGWSDEDVNYSTQWCFQNFVQVGLRLTGALCMPAQRQRAAACRQPPRCHAPCPVSCLCTAESASCGQVRSMKRARDVREQLLGLMERTEVGLCRCPCQVAVLPLPVRQPCCAPPCHPTHMPVQFISAGTTRRLLPRTHWHP